MAKTEVIFGWEIERVNDRRVRLTKGDRVIDLKGGPDLEGDELVKRAVLQAEAYQEPAPAGAHVIEVPVGTMSGASNALGKE